MNSKRADVVIIGAGLTGLTMAYYLKKSGINPLVLERSEKPGGVIRTYSEGGFNYESGPNTGVLSTIEIAALFDELKESCTLETGNRDSKKRYILKDGRWQALPSGLFSAISTPLFTLKDKFRILGEPFRKPGSDPDESVADMVIRRLGRSYLDYAVDPFISGIYAGDPARLVTRYALPKLYALEHNYGSFIKGSVAKSREKKSDEEKKATKEVFSVSGGLGNLISALTLKTGYDSVICGISDLKIMYSNPGFSICFSTPDGQDHNIITSRVVSTAGSASLPGIFPFLSHETLSPILDLEYAGIVQVAVGYNDWTGFPLDAFGGLVPSREKKEILGILFPSAIFKDRAPENGALLSVFLGGIKNKEAIGKSDNEIRNIVLNEIQSTMMVNINPDLFKIFRYEHAIPQYGKSTGQRLDRIRKLEDQYPGLVLAGNIRDGIGMADRVKQARSIADLLRHDK
jgi:oxygen-dependent protoporphyrinogen oxidase